MNEPFPVDIAVRADQPLGELTPIWRFFGCDEPNYAYMPNGRKLLGELGALAPGSVYFRAHNLLTTGDGTPALKWGSTNAYTDGPDGSPIYDWTILDRIFDTYLAQGLRPYVQIGFMPEALSIHPHPYRHNWTSGTSGELFTGWAYPPRDYDKWGQLVERWAAHCIERYGPAEVEQWYWQTWNEPNIGYWKGTPEEFCKLNDFAIAAVRRVLPTARVGGPDVAGDGGSFTRTFLDHCLRGTNHATGERGTPLDFVSFHAKGAPKFVDGHVRMGIAEHLRTIDKGFGLIASYPELRGRPIIIGESDPEGCAACQGPALGYRNGTMYSSYTAASFPRKLELAERHGVNFAGALTWAFEFEDQPYFAGFRALATNGIDLPVLNVFRMFAKMDGERLAVESSGAVALDAMLQGGVRERPDVSAIASVEPGRLSVLLWHYHDDDLPGPDASVTLTLTALPLTIDRARLSEFRVDGSHGNSYALWQAMGSPQHPTPIQYEQLERAGRLAETRRGEPVAVHHGQVDLRLTLPRQGVCLVQLNWG